MTRRALVMGVLNVTPDSFSDGGTFLDADAAITHGLSMMRAGADFIDVGGESSRPGATPVSVEDEGERVLPVIKGLLGAANDQGVRISIDTVKPKVAEQCVEAGATLINDISGTLSYLAGSLGVGWVAMHMQGNPRTMQKDPSYQNVTEDVYSSLIGAARLARTEHRVKEIWLDPGIGFGKTPEHNLQLLAHLDQLVEIATANGCQVMVGTSRKSFLGKYQESNQRPFIKDPVQVTDRLEASLATAVWAMAKGAGMVRVHDVKESVQAAQLCCTRD